MTYAEIVDAARRDAFGVEPASGTGACGAKRAVNSLNITLILSGSIAAYKACELASRLVKAGHEVQTVATNSALRFVGKASLEGITERKAYTSLWAPRESKTHITLRRWADVFVFYPATANRINRLAAGLAEDLVGAIFLANNFEKPFYIAPAMNTNMLKHPATQEAIARLSSWGTRFVYGEEGRLACGDSGAGRLAEPEHMFRIIEAEASRIAGRRIAAWATKQRGAHETPEALAARQQRILVTGGAMKEPIDKVRFIMNMSSGHTASTAVKALVQSGWQVDYLHHRSAQLAGAEGATCFAYDTYADFAEIFEQLLRENKFDAVFHAAAVSDYRVGRIECGTNGAAPRQAGDSNREGAGKIASDNDVRLVLEQNEKQLAKIGLYAGQRPFVAACKLTSGLDEAEGVKKARAYIDSGTADLVVWNDTLGMQDGRHSFVLLDRSQEGEAVEKARGTALHELCAALVHALNARQAVNLESGKEDTR